MTHNSDPPKALLFKDNLKKPSPSAKALRVALFDLVDSTLAINELLMDAILSNSPQKREWLTQEMPAIINNLKLLRELINGE